METLMDGKILAGVAVLCMSQRLIKQNGENNLWFYMPNMFKFL